MERRGRPIETIVTTTIEYEDDEEEQEETTLREAMNVAFQVSFILLTGVSIYMVVGGVLRKVCEERKE